MYRLDVYNSARERIGTIQNEESVQWLENYRSPGEAKIITRVTENNLSLLVDGNRIYNTESNTVMKISNVDIVEGVDEKSIIARADVTSRTLADRVVMATEKITNIEQGMYAVYRNNRRGLPLELGGVKGYTDRTETEITWNSVLDAVQTLAENSDMGFRVIFDPETGVETFEVYKGSDRSAQGGKDYVGFFSSDVGNLRNIQITSGSSNYKNVAVVAGAGEGTDRYVRTVSLGNFAGENRRELYVDARNLQWDYQVAVDTGQKDEQGNPIYDYDKRTYTTAEYNALLDACGKEKLAEHLFDYIVSCDIEQNNIVYGKDYFLGDRLPVKISEYNLNASAIVSSINRVYERNGITIVATLSDFRTEE